MRRRDRPRGRRGRLFLRQRELPGADARIDSPFRVQGPPRHRRPRRQAGRAVGRAGPGQRTRRSFRLTKDQLAGLERMADKSAQNVLDAIERSRKTTLDRLINGLGIRHVGEHTARQLALRFKTLEALMEASEDDLLGVRDIGAEVARSIREYFDEPRNRKAVERLDQILEVEVAGRGGRAGRAARQEVRVDRHARIDDPRGGRAQNPRGRRPRDFFGQPQDRFVVAGADPGSKLRKAHGAGRQDPRRARASRAVAEVKSMSDEDQVRESAPDRQRAGAGRILSRAAATRPSARTHRMGAQSARRHVEIVAEGERENLDAGGMGTSGPAVCARRRQVREDWSDFTGEFS